MLVNVFNVVTVGITDDHLSEFIVLYREHCEVRMILLMLIV